MGLTFITVLGWGVYVMYMQANRAPSAERGPIVGGERVQAIALPSCQDPPLRVRCSGSRVISSELPNLDGAKYTVKRKTISNHQSFLLYIPDKN